VFLLHALKLTAWPGLRRAGLLLIPAGLCR
jgi:hypothetical protein